LPSEFLNYIESIAKPKAYKSIILDKATHRLKQKVKEPIIAKTTEKELKPVISEKDNDLSIRKILFHIL
jgi:hypothetical protein